MGVTTNTQALCANGSYPTSVSVVTNISTVQSTITTSEIGCGLIAFDSEFYTTIQAPPQITAAQNDVVRAMPTETVTVSETLTRPTAKQRVSGLNTYV